MSSTATCRTLALTHLPSPRIAHGERTYVARAAIAYPRAVEQHKAYCELLRTCGAEVHVLNVNSGLPDSVFIEDTAIVLDEVVVIASMGAESRRAEPDAIELELHRHRQVRRIAAPATIEGGDVLRVGRTLLAGLSSRTNRAGMAALEASVRFYGYKLVPVPVHCLHLKTACTALPDGTLLVNPAWLDMEQLGDFECVAVPETEPWGANVALVGSNICVAAAGYPRTAEMILARGFGLRTVDLSEFAKAEGGVTCLSILLTL